MHDLRTLVKHKIDRIDLSINRSRPTTLEYRTLRVFARGATSFGTIAAYRTYRVQRCLKSLTVRLVRVVGKQQTLKLTDALHDS